MEIQIHIHIYILYTFYIVPVCFTTIRLHIAISKKDILLVEIDSDRYFFVNKNTFNLLLFLF